MWNIAFTFDCRGPRLFGALATTLVLFGCSATKVVNTADDIRADDNGNIVLMSYDVTVFGVDGHRSNAINSKIRFNCLNVASGKEEPCFSIPVSRSVKRLENVSVTAFGSDGAKPYSLKYGDYVLNSIYYSIQDGVRESLNCYKNDRGNTHCYPVTTPTYATGESELPEPIRFAVDPGDGCFLGHFRIVMQADDLIEFEYVEAMNDAKDRVNVNLRRAVRSHVQGLCHRS